MYLWYCYYTMTDKFDKLKMKKINYLWLLFIGIATACNSSAKQEKEVVPATKESAPAGTSINTKEKADSAHLLIAGKRAGNIYLGQDMENVFKLLGRPEDGDAAMGSAIGIWDKKTPLIIFSSYRDSNMVVKAVKQISVSAASYTTAEGIHTGVSLRKLKTIYPALKKAAFYTNAKTRGQLTVYDDESKGIAFDIQKDTCTAITIHPINKSVNGVYLTMYPDWKKS